MNLLWQYDSTDLWKEWTTAVARFEERVGQPATKILVRDGERVILPLTVELKEVSFVTPGTRQVAGGVE